MSTTGKVTRHSLLDRIFEISLILKGLDGVLELVGGVVLLLVSPKQLTSIVILVTQHELSQDPKFYRHAPAGLRAYAVCLGHNVCGSVFTGARYREDRFGRRCAQRTTLGISLADWVLGDFYSLPDLSPHPACLGWPDRSHLVRLLYCFPHGA